MSLIDITFKHIGSNVNIQSGGIINNGFNEQYVEHILYWNLGQFLDTTLHRELKESKGNFKP